MAKKKTGPAEDQGKLLKEAQALGKSLGMEYEDIADIQDQILKKQIKSNQALFEAVKLTKQSVDAYKLRSKLEDDAYTQQQEKIKLDEKAKKLILDQTKAARQYNSITEDLQDSIKKSHKNIFSNTEDTYNAQKKIVNQRRQEIKEAQELGHLSDEDAAIQEASLKAINDQIDATQKLQNEYQSQFESLSALGGFLKKNFGEVGEILEGSINKGMEAFTAEMAESGDSALASKKAMKAFGGEITSSIASMFTIAGAAALLFKILEDASKEITEFAAASGASVAQSEALVTSAKSYAAASGLSLATAKESLVVQQEMIKATGNVNSLSAETATKVVQIGEAFGYGAELAGKVQASMMGIGASAEDAMKIQGFTSALAEAAGVAPGAVMQDIAQNAKITAKFFAGNPKALAKAAVEAAKMGMSLSDMVSVADKLLDIEGSLNSQFEASAMLGRNINMDKARQLALDGKIELATKAALEQVGTLAEFEAMRPLQKKKIAEAAGLEVGQIEKALQLQEASKNMTDEQKAAVAKYGDALGDVSKMNEEDILQRTSSLQAADELNATMTQLKDMFTVAILPAAKLFGTLLSWALTPVALLVEGFGEIYNFFTGMSTTANVLAGILATITTFMLAIKAAQIVTTQQAGLKAAFDMQSQKSLIIQGWTMLKTLGTAIATAVANITSMSAMTLGIAGGIALAAGATAYAFLNSKKTGDLGIDANGGPVVMSPRENAIFQGTKNDDVAMYPGATSGGGSTDMSETNSLLRQLLSAMNTPVPVVIGDKAINEIGKQYATNSSYKPAGSR